MFTDIFIEVESQLVNDRHASFNHIKNVLHVLHQTLVSLYVFESLNHVSRVVHINLQLFSNQTAPHLPQSALYIPK